MQIMPVTLRNIREIPIIGAKFLSVGKNPLLRFHWNNAPGDNWTTMPNHEVLQDQIIETMKEGHVSQKIIRSYRSTPMAVNYGSMVLEAAASLDLIELRKRDQELRGPIAGEGLMLTKCILENDLQGAVDNILSEWTYDASLELLHPLVFDRLKSLILKHLQQALGLKHSEDSFRRCVSLLIQLPSKIFTTRNKNEKKDIPSDRVSSLISRQIEKSCTQLSLCELVQAMYLVFILSDADHLEYNLATRFLDKCKQTEHFRGDELPTIALGVAFIQILLDDYRKVPIDDLCEKLHKVLPQCPAKLIDHTFMALMCHIFLTANKTKPEFSFEVAVHIEKLLKTRTKRSPLKLKHSIFSQSMVFWSQMLTRSDTFSKPQLHQHLLTLQIVNQQHDPDNVEILSTINGRICANGLFEVTALDDFVNSLSMVDFSHQSIYQTGLIYNVVPILATFGRIEDIRKLGLLEALSQWPSDSPSRSTPGISRVLSSLIVVGQMPHALYDQLFRSVAEVLPQRKGVYEVDGWDPHVWATIYKLDEMLSLVKNYTGARLRVDTRKSIEESRVWRKSLCSETAAFLDSIEEELKSIRAIYTEYVTSQELILPQISPSPDLLLKAAFSDKKILLIPVPEWDTLRLYKLGRLQDGLRIPFQCIPQIEIRQYAFHMKLLGYKPILIQRTMYKQNPDTYLRQILRKHNVI